MRDAIVLALLYLLTAGRILLFRRPLVGYEGLGKSLEPALFLGVGAVLLTHFGCSLRYISGRSMQPTLGVHEVVLVNHVPYRWGRPWRGEIALLVPPPPFDKGERVIIKRIVALGGDFVAVRDGQLYLNGQAVTESYISSPTQPDFKERRVADGSVFVMGDNRANSLDSRVFGEIPQARLLGRADLRLWPVAKAGRL